MPDWFMPTLILIVIAGGFMRLITRKPKKPKRKNKGISDRYKASISIADVREQERRARIEQLEREIREIKKRRW